jgi:NedA-like, galactose-binding domain/Secretion system C-terminal sorting domain
MKFYTFFLLTSIILFCDSAFSQSRINYNNQDLFLNGSNVAWVNFAHDIGPGTTNFARFSQIFAEIKAAGGNSFRFWLHTDGTSTPEFDSNGLVVGPGAGAISDLKQILDLAWQNKIGLLLCLWSHDMMSTAYSTQILDRNEKLLTDTTALRAYIDNALIPMVDSVKGHPAIIAWEIFNEPEGFTEVGNWSDRRHVTEFDVERFVNLTAGAIHRTDPTAKVTNGTWGLTALTDVATLAKRSAQSFINSLTEDQKHRIEMDFATKYGMHLSAKEIINKVYAASNVNYYRDDRLIAAGGDPDGTLDFYTVHYYSWAGTALSPFHHPYSYWGLNKPLAIAEFFMEDTYGVPYQNLYEQLYRTGYAGALSWQWLGDTQANDNAKNNNHTRTVAAINDLYNSYPYDVVLAPVTGTIYSFEATPDTIESGESTLLKWITPLGSTPTLNGVSVAEGDSMIISPDSTTTYFLITNNDVAETSYVKVEVLFPGTIYSFTAFPPVVSKGEQVELKWKTTNNSTVHFDDNLVNQNDSTTVTIDTTTSYTLTAEGVVKDTSKLTVSVLPADQVDRALHRSVTVSSGDAPENLVDGDSNSYWDTGENDSQWIQVALEDYYIVNKIILKWGPGFDFASSYRVYNYNNAFLPKLLFQETSGNGGNDTIQVTDNNLKTLRINFDQSSEQLGYSLLEVEIYGTKKVTFIDDLPVAIKNYKLEQNYPNPFNPASTIWYQIPKAGFVKLKVYDILGNEVATLVNEYKTPNNYEAVFNGSKFASGVYIYQLIVNDFISTKKMVLLK